MKFLHLNFIPRSADFALLVLRLWYGVPMLLLHGWGKLTGFSGMLDKFVDPIGVGKAPSLAMITFAEVVCAGLIAIGLFTRLAALISAIGMGTAFWIVHGHRLSGPANGEMAFLYLGAWVVLILAGAGKYSVDANIGAKA